MSVQYKVYFEKGYNGYGYLSLHPSAKVHNAWLDCSGRLTIEENVEIGDNVRIYTHAHQFDKKNWRDLPIIVDSLVIHKGAFIGANVIILSKVKRIGKYSVIGAGSVLTKSVPDYEIWAGNPAKKIGDIKK